jgi:PAS domain S-box-containing protein
MGQSGTPLAGFYDFRLAALSVFICISASYAALDLGGRVTATHGWRRGAWLVGGSAAMGLGIWSMHFTGMLAFHLPVPVAYYWPTVLLSVLAAIVGSALALHVVSRKEMGRVQALTGSILMGFAIAGMHYIGMAAMRLPAECHYSFVLVVASVLIAVVASFVSLVFCFDYREDFRGTTAAKVLSATLMGAAISALHYTGMAAASFFATTRPVQLAHTESISSLGTAAIVVSTLTVQAVAMWTSAMDRQLASQAVELQRSERFRQIADNLPLVLALASADLSEFLYVNRAYEKIWGRTIDSLYANPLSFLEGIHPDDHGRLKEALSSLLNGFAVDGLECRVIQPDGSTCWVLCRGFAVRSAGGQIDRLVGSAQDITEQREAELELHREQTYLVMGQRIAAMGTWAWKPSSQEMVGSQEFCRIFGLDPESAQLRREVFLQRLHPDDRSRYEQTISAALSQRMNWEVDYRIVLPNGSVRHIRGAGSPVLDESGEISELVGTVLDVSERKQGEEALHHLSMQLLQLQDEERRSIARDLHDSTGPDLAALATILGQLEKGLDFTERKSRRLLSECKALAEKCIREIRTLSYVLHSPVLDQAGLSGAIRDYVKGFTARSGIQVTLELSQEIGRMPRDVELALFRVVQESLTNIQRHSGNREAAIRLDRNSQLTLQIIDSRTPVSRDSMGRSEKSPYQYGVGILSMQERVKLIGGRLEIYTANGGTLVRVTIPLGEEHEKAADSVG